MSQEFYKGCYRESHEGLQRCYWDVRDIFRGAIRVIQVCYGCYKGFESVVYGCSLVVTWFAWE